MRKTSPGCKSVRSISYLRRGIEFSRHSLGLDCLEPVRDSCRGGPIFGSSGFFYTMSTISADQLERIFPLILGRETSVVSVEWKPVFQGKPPMHATYRETELVLRFALFLESPREWVSTGPAILVEESVYSRGFAKKDFVKDGLSCYL